MDKRASSPARSKEWPAYLGITTIIDGDILLKINWISFFFRIPYRKPSTASKTTAKMRRSFRFCFGANVSRSGPGTASAVGMQHWQAERAKKKKIQEQSDHSCGRQRVNAR
jgi:hypothetical protein